MITSGEGKYKVFLDKIELDSDLVFIVGGGEKSHIGAIVICEKNKEPKTIKLDGHYDYVVLEPIAKAAYEKYNKKVLVIGGIHIDNASKQEIDIIIKNCKELSEKL